MNACSQGWHWRHPPASCSSSCSFWPAPTGLLMLLLLLLLLLMLQCDQRRTSNGGERLPITPRLRPNAGSRARVDLSGAPQGPLAPWCNQSRHHQLEQ